MNNEKQVSFISKEYSKHIYGICILMMLWHHLFGFPERFDVNFTSAFGEIASTLYLLIGYFCKICVSIYAFMTGYGLMTKYIKVDITYFDLFIQMMKRIFHFYLKYWLVLIVFLIVGLVLNVRTFELLSFVKNVIGLSCTYNAEWWYVNYYLKMLLIFPVAYYLFKKCKQYIFPILVIILLLFYLNAWNGAQVYVSYIIGLLSAYYSKYLISLINLISKNCLIHLLIIFCCTVLIIPIQLKLGLSNDFNFIYSFIFIFGLVSLFELIQKVKFLNPLLLILESVGKQNMYIWLTHSFFLYYYFKDVFEYLNNGILAYLLLLIVSYITSISLNYMYDKISLRRI